MGVWYKQEDLRSKNQERKNNPMIQGPNSKKFDLLKRTQEFAKNVREFIKKIPRSVGNFEDTKQLVRSSGSIGANYIEANESLGEKDFTMRCKICLKESKESKFWLSLLDTGKENSLESQQQNLMKEATELLLIFSSIVRKRK